MQTSTPSEKFQQEQTPARGLFGIFMTTQMMQELDWNSIRIYDIIMGLWRDKSFRGVVSNARFAEALGIDERSVQRAISKLVDLGYLRRAVRGTRRELLPGGVVVQGDTDVVLNQKTAPSMTNLSPLARQDCHPKHDKFVTKKQENKKQEIFEREETPPSQKHGSILAKKTYDAEYFLAQGKEPAKEFPELFFNVFEKDAIRAYYAQEDLDLEEGLRLLQHCAYNNSERFLTYSSHYHCMVGWVAQEMRRNQRDKLYLTKAKKGK